MNSCLFDCTIAHRRTSPRKHAFKYSIFMFYLDLSEIDSLSKRFRLLGRNHFAPYAFHDKDHYTVGGLSNRESVIRYLREKGVKADFGKIYLLTHLRTWGHVFNPVSFYFVLDTMGEEICTVAEVGNTFNERKMFLIPQGDVSKRVDIQKKEFYVSPFSDLDTCFHFKLKLPRNHLRLAIDQSKDGQTFFRSALSGRRKPLTDWGLLRYTLKFPIVTIGIVAGIHWQALILFLKGIRVRRKRENPHLQTETSQYLTSEKHAIH